MLAQAKGVGDVQLRGFSRRCLSPASRRPDFTLPSTAGEISLRDLTERGKVVLAFYYEDATPMCSNEVSMLKDDYEVVRELGGEVIAVSADSLESHAAFAERLGGVPFPLASDERLEAAKAFDVVDDGGKRSRRAVFVIDRGGKILHAEPGFSRATPASTRRSSGRWGWRDDKIVSIGELNGKEDHSRIQGCRTSTETS